MRRWHGWLVVGVACYLLAGGASLAAQEPKAKPPKRATLSDRLDALRKSFSSRPEAEPATSPPAKTPAGNSNPATPRAGSAARPAAPAESAARPVVSSPTGEPRTPAAPKAASQPRSASAKLNGGTSRAAPLASPERPPVSSSRRNAAGTPAPQRDPIYTANRTPLGEAPRRTDPAVAKPRVAAPPAASPAASGTFDPGDDIFSQEAPSATAPLDPPEAAPTEPEPVDTPPPPPTAPVVSERPAVSERMVAPGAGLRETPRRDLASDRDRQGAPSSPHLSVETVGPRRIIVGKEARYEIQIHNSGDVPADDVVVTLVVPDSAEVLATQARLGVTQTETTETGVRYQWTVAQVAAGQSTSLELTLVPRASRPLDLSVRWTYSPPASQTLVEVQEPRLEMSVVGPAEVLYGEKELYRLTLSNPGTGDAENVAVTLLPIAEGEEPAASHTVGTLPAGGSRVIEVELTARQAGRLTIRAEATAEGGLRAQVSEPVLVRRAALQVAVSGPRVLYAQTPSSYEVRVMNPGNAAARDVEVVVALPPQAEYIASSGSGRLEPERNVVLWTLHQLEPGAEEVFVVKCSLLQGGANRVEATVTASGELKDAKYAVTEVEAVADLAIDVVDPAGPCPIDQEALYEITVHNRGSRSAEEVEVVGYFSEGVEPIAVEGGRADLGEGSVIFRPLPTLAAGREVVLKIRARANKPGTHRFRAELYCKAPETQLTVEETTLFYGLDEAIEPQPRASAATKSNEAPSKPEVSPEQSLPGPQ
jgi:Domain of unknown function DUF11